MFHWAFLFVCYVVAVRLAAAMGVVTCETLKSGGAVAIPSSNDSLTPSDSVVGELSVGKC